MGETAAISGAATGIINAGGDFASSIFQAKSIKAQARMQEQAANFNAAMADLQAKDVSIRAEKDVTKVRKLKKQVIGAQRAALAAQGIDISQGSALDTQQDTERLAEEDVEQIRTNAWKEAFGYRVQAMQFRQEARGAIMAGRNRAKNTVIASGINALGEISSAASSFAGPSGGGGGGAPKSGGSKVASPFTVGYGK